VPDEESSETARDKVAPSLCSLKSIISGLMWGLGLRVTYRAFHEKRSMTSKPRSTIGNRHLLRQASEWKP